MGHHQAPGWRRPRSFRRRPMRMQRTTGNLCLGFLNMTSIMGDFVKKWDYEWDYQYDINNLGFLNMGIMNDYGHYFEKKMGFL